MSRRTLAQRLAAYVAVMACVLFALGVRDTPPRVLLPPDPTPSPSASPFERDATLQVIVLARANDAGATAVQPQASKETRAGLSDEAQTFAGQTQKDPSDAEQDEGAEPIVSARVRVFYEYEGRFHWVGAAETDENGRTRIASLPRGVLWITAEAPGHARSSTQFVMDEREREKELYLGSAKELAVTVHDERDAPIEQATVLVSTTDPLPYGALTDREGRASVGRLGPGPYRVRVSARGYESANLRGIAAPLTVKLRRLGSLLVKVVNSEEVPEPGASVTLSGTSLWPARRVTTDERGQARVQGLLAGSFDLRAVKGDRVSRTELGVQLGRGEQREVTLRLIPGRAVTVFVTDGDEEPAVPVANADVVVAEGGLSTFPERGRTQADGKVTLGPFEPGSLTASATARDFVGTSVVPVPNEGTGPVRVALRRGGTIAGTVVDMYDHPIDGATIEVVGTDFFGMPVAETPRYRALQAAGFARAVSGPEALLAVGELGVTQGPVPPIPGAAPAAEYLLSSDELRRRSPVSPLGSTEIEQWVSRYDGSFRAHPVTPGRLRALVRHPAYVEGQSDLFTLGPGATAEVKVTLRAGGAIEGLVVDRYGRPVGGVRVELSATLGSRVQATYTADDGAFAFASLPAEVTITAARPENPDRAVVREHVTVREGKREPVRIVLPEARDAVEVLVVDERDQPLENVEVVMASLESASPLRQTRFTGQDGRTEFADARDLEVAISAESPGYAPAHERVSKAAERIKLVLRRGVVVTGRITSVRGRVPVAHARITLAGGGRRRMAMTNDDGVWQLADVPEGSIHLTVDADTFPIVELDRSVVRQARQDRPFDLGEIDLPDAGNVAGVVVDQRGDPVPGAQVSTQPIASYSPASAPQTGVATTNKSGQYRLGPVAVGKTVVHAFAPGVGRGQSEPVEVLRGRDREDIRIKLDRPAVDEAHSGSTASVAMNLSSTAGAIAVELVAPASEAERAGVRPGDHLISIDGVKPRDVGDARARLSGAENSDVLLELEREGKTVRVRTVRELVRR